jgi:phospholipid/cholesterol/gamma-HCH transport system substrate-binding protein
MCKRCNLFQKFCNPFTNTKLYFSEMDNHTQNFKIRLGLFVAGGLTLFVLAIFVIGKQKNLFNPIFKLTSTFSNVSGLQVGNNIRFSGINVGTVDNIIIVNDTTVRVDLMLKTDVWQFIKSDCKVTLGSDGIIGDKLIIIIPGSSDAPLAKEGQRLESIETIVKSEIMARLDATTANIEDISKQVSDIAGKINSGNGTLNRLIRDSTFAENLNQTMINLRKSSKGLDENMNAAKHNFLFRGYFKKKDKEAAEKKEELIESEKNNLFNPLSRSASADEKEVV